MLTKVPNIFFRDNYTKWSEHARICYAVRVFPNSDNFQLKDAGKQGALNAVQELC
jgi:hypothetical protein